MEKQEFATKEELTEFSEKLDESLREIQGLKSTIEILQDKEAMKDIRETEEALRNGEKLEKVNLPEEQKRKQDESMIEGCNEMYRDMIRINSEWEAVDTESDWEW